jgi:hypothetical protein
MTEAGKPQDGMIPFAFGQLTSQVPHTVNCSTVQNALVQIDAFMRAAFCRYFVLKSGIKN